MIVWIIVSHWLVEQLIDSFEQSIIDWHERKRQSVEKSNSIIRLWKKWWVLPIIGWEFFIDSPSGFEGIWMNCRRILDWEQEKGQNDSENWQMKYFIVFETLSVNKTGSGFGFWVLVSWNHVSRASLTKMLQNMISENNKIASFRLCVCHIVQCCQRLKDFAYSVLHVSGLTMHIINESNKFLNLN